MGAVMWIRIHLIRIFFQIRIKIMWIQIQHQKCAPQLTQMKYLFKASVYRDFRALFFQQSTPTWQTG